MTHLPARAVSDYSVDVRPDLSRLDTRKRLSGPAINEFFAIMDTWQIPTDRAGELLGGVPRSTLYKLKSAGGTLRQDQLMRISYIMGIFSALHILLPDDLANHWVKQPNDYLLFRGRPPVDYMVSAGIPGLGQVRNVLEAECNGR